MKEIKYFAPDTRVIILSMYSKEEYIRHSLENGAFCLFIKTIGFRRAEGCNTICYERTVIYKPNYIKTNYFRLVDGKKT